MNTVELTEFFNYAIQNRVSEADGEDEEEEKGSLR